MKAATTLLTLSADPQLPQNRGRSGGVAIAPPKGEDGRRVLPCECGGVRDYRATRCQSCFRPARPPYLGPIGWEIPLTQGFVALLDEIDVERVAARGQWVAVVRGRNLHYATCGDTYMHRLVLSAGPGVEIDHVNGNGLDNRRANLRFATRSQNLQNRASQGGTSRFKGVAWDRARGRWKAAIKIDGYHHNLGRFDSEIEAARAYDRVALEAFGEFALTNAALFGAEVAS